MGLALLVHVGGCSSTQKHAPPEDPLHRTPATPPPDPLLPAAPAPNQQGSRSIPPIPTTLAATNNATLASNNWTLAGSRTLAIPERASNEPAPGQLTSGAAPQTPSGPPAPPRVFAVPSDNAPAGVQPASSWSSPTSAPGAAMVTPAAAPAAAVTTENFARLLGERGFALQHLRQASLAQGVHVTCIATFQNNPEQSVFEVTAVDFDAAGQAILREAERRVATLRR
jgi:hypothetical protein